jgi:acetyl esterase/lipase
VPLLLALLLALNVVPAAGTDAPACEPARNVRYHHAPGVDPDLLSLDVYPVDDCGGNPVLIWVHGGGWRTGDKRNAMADKVRWAHENGWALISVNYRLTPPARYPTHNRDVARAVAWVTQEIDAYGGDPDRLALLGHSAGAQIVASVGMGSDAVSCLVPIDTEGFDVARVIRGGGRKALLYRSVFGNHPRVWRAASPVHQTHPDVAPTLLVRRGDRERRLQMAGFATALRADGVPVTVVPTPGYSHGDVNRLIGVDDLLTPALEDFLAGCLELR